MILNNLLIALWLLAGAGLANMAPVFASRIPVLKDWNKPLDLGLTFRNKPLLGKNKTWRGLASGIVIATLTVYLQQLSLTKLNADIDINGVSFIDLPTITLGILLGLGALVGDAIESFFKRQAGIDSGKSWFPFDQIDYIIGAIVFTWALIPLTLLQYSLLLLTGFVGHLVFSYIAYLLKFKKTPI